LEKKFQLEKKSCWSSYALNFRLREPPFCSCKSYLLRRDLPIFIRLLDVDRTRSQPKSRFLFLVGLTEQSVDLQARNAFPKTPGNLFRTRRVGKHVLVGGNFVTEKVDCRTVTACAGAFPRGLGALVFGVTRTNWQLCRQIIT
jgi:hypothetical protein